MTDSSAGRLKRLAAEVCEILAYGVAGAVLAGAYGILHDQITWSISREYFTNFKFHQFAYVGIGMPDRGRVGEIGFLATWWVGAFAGMVLAAVAMFRCGHPLPAGRMAQAFGIVTVFGIAGGITGEILGYLRRSDPDFGNWSYFATELHVGNLPAFVNVGYIHNGSYLGAAAGLLAALLVIMMGRHTPGTQ